ncbi:unnamed protein product [Clonostachys byssicola]|uniref:Peroxisomal membrane protein PEX14 n=1 Tax=Clonostachys byssicola TaxID=160290 RepID=A0A9N9XYH7_9HYPO|nr:unnamed protein product [Clonostachys byssicola]
MLGSRDQSRLFHPHHPANLLPSSRRVISTPSGSLLIAGLNTQIMTEEEEKPDSGIPEWQRSQEDTEGGSKTTNEDSTTTTDEDRIKVARRFLEDEKIKTSPRESKIAFLRGKGIDEADIKELLGEVEFSQPLASAADEPSTSSPIHSPPESVLSNRDRAPIVTYPEFLTPKAESSPPLLTRNRLVIILQLFAFISTLVVGSSRFILRPMLDRLTDSRIDLYTSTTKALAPLLSKLEKSVSQVPPRIKTRNDSDQDSDSDDPSEMFHHDVGTQTSTPPPSVSPIPVVKPSEAQATRLESLTQSLKDLEGGIRSQSDGLGDVKTLLDVFRDDLDTLTYPTTSDLPGYDLLSRSRKSEPEDEIRKVRDSIRRVKGVLLSTRSFPSSIR